MKVGEAYERIQKLEICVRQVSNGISALKGCPVSADDPHGTGYDVAITTLEAKRIELGQCIESLKAMDVESPPPQQG